MPHAQLMIEDRPAGYRWLRLARPERRNALDVDLMLAVRDAIAAEPETPVLLGSADPQVFCAGADLTISDSERSIISDLIYDCCETMITRPGPVISVITGAAVGGGAQLAAASDLRIAGPGARLRWIGPPGTGQGVGPGRGQGVGPGTGQGVGPGTGQDVGPGPGLAVGAWLLPDLIGRGAAMDVVLTGRWVEAAEALALGLVNRVSDDPERDAEQIAADLAARGAAAGVAAGATAGVKAVMAAGGLLDRLRAEREVNRAAWARVTGVNHLGLPAVEHGRVAGAPTRGRGPVRLRRGTGRRHDSRAGRRVRSLGAGPGRDHCRRRAGDPRRAR
jgi:enoyl-CoA hydratase/carnithine racemase